MAKKATAKKPTAKKAKAKAKKAKAKNAAPVPKPAAPVPIRISGVGVVLDRVAKVKRGQGVRWIAQDGGGPWTITFPGGSPFSGSEYRVPRGGTVSTTNGAKGPVGKTYRYTVSNENVQTDEAEVVVE
jgi:hypothetical protein